MSYKLKIYFDDGDIEIVDEKFKTEEDAQNEYNEWLEGYSVDSDVLGLEEDEYGDAEIIGCDIYEE